MFFCLQDLGVHEIYKKAGEILSQRGLSQTLTYDPYTKEVDVEGAILIACGASEKILATDENDISKIGLPEANIVKVLISIEYIEAMIDDELPNWCLSHDTDDAVKMLKRLSDRVEMSVVKQRG